MTSKNQKTPIKRFEATDKKRVLQVGYGLREKRPLHQIFKGPEWEVIHLDTIADTSPNIQGDITWANEVPDESMDAVWLVDSLKFLYLHQAALALKECFRVLKPNGIAFMTVPDIQKIAEFVQDGKLAVPLYKTPEGGITALDMLFGPVNMIAAGAHECTHKTGYTARTLADKIGHAGFGRIKVKKEGFHLWASAYKVPLAEAGKVPLQIDEPDINDMIRLRDALDQEPQIWKGFSRKKDKE
ncbi:MAG: Methyltransferase type 12 [Rickettsiales bacterium]|jgi:SAM-dependent methyltransferase|nr:Methyltransferase type 12 [Rickettsiales bacterium]